MTCVRRSNNHGLNPKYTCPIINHEGRLTMVWSCFSSYEVGPVCKTKGAKSNTKTT